MFKSKIFILPGLGNSGEDHWQTHWENQFNFTRIQQRDWDKPVCAEWIETIDKQIETTSTNQIIFVGHSLACATIVNWATRYYRKIKGALLVAPSDTEATSFPKGTTGFTPMPLKKLEFPSITITSSNDFYVTLERAKFFANAWGSPLINIGDAGHINTAAGFGRWDEGLEYLKKLDV